MKSHSSRNGNQTKLLDRELRRAEKLADRLDRALALAETGARDQGSGTGERLTSGAHPPAPGPRPPVPGAWAKAYSASAPLQSAPVVPVPAPTPGDRPLAPGSVPRGEFESTFGISGTPIPSRFLYALGEYNLLLAALVAPRKRKPRRSPPSSGTISLAGSNSAPRSAPGRPRTGTTWCATPF